MYRTKSMGIIIKTVVVMLVIFSIIIHFFLKSEISCLDERISEIEKINIIAAECYAGINKKLYDDCDSAFFYGSNVMVEECRRQEYVENHRRCEDIWGERESITIEPEEGAESSKSILDKWIYADDIPLDDSDTIEIEIIGNENNEDNSTTLEVDLNDEVGICEDGICGDGIRIDDPIFIRMDSFESNDGFIMLKYDDRGCKDGNGDRKESL